MGCVTWLVYVNQGHGMRLLRSEASFAHKLKVICIYTNACETKLYTAIEFPVELFSFGPYAEHVHCIAFHIGRNCELIILNICSIWSDGWLHSYGRIRATDKHLLKWNYNIIVTYYWLKEDAILNQHVLIESRK